MNTIFEVFVANRSAEYAQGMAQELFKELDHLEGLLSRFDPSSDIAQLNRLLPGQSLTIAHETLECLLLGFWLHEETKGAFDPSVGHLMDRWREDGNEGRDDPTYREPAFQDIEQALRHTHFEWILLDTQAHRVSLRNDAPYRVEIDLGGVGKGYALDHLAELLEDWSVEDILLHAGSSTALALGSCPPHQGWILGAAGRWAGQTGVDRLLLTDRALSGSGTEVKGEHVLDPRTGYPASSHQAAWATAPSAGLADGLSTAFMVMTEEQVRSFCQSHRDIGAILIRPKVQDVVVNLLCPEDRIERKDVS